MKSEGQFLRLSDGRFLIEDLSIQGDGVTATAQGSRSLFGGLDLKGHAVVQELGRWKAGVQGAAEGDWTASQARAQADWKFSAQLKTRQIQTPIPELSRLLGGQPNLEAHGIFDGHQIIFSDAKIAGSALSAKGSGHLGLDGRLAVDLDWTARGPFGVGPVEVTGNASGKGMIGGNVARPELQLGAHFDQVALPDFALTDASLTLVFKRTQDGGDGTFNLRANSQYGPGYVSSGFNFVPGGLQLSALDANLAGVTASGDVSLAGNGPSRANLVLDVGPGAFLLRGQAHGTLRIEDGSSSALTHLDLRLSNLVPRAYNIAVGDGHLVADGPYNALNFTFSGNGASASGPWSLGLGGLAEQKEGRLTLVATGDGKLAKTAFTMLEPARIVLGNSRTDVDARLGIGSGMATVTARFGQDGGQARGQFSALDLRLVNQDLTGKVDGTVELSGKGARLDGTMDVRLLDARTIGAPVAQGLSGKMMVLLRDSQMEVRADLANQLGLTSHLNMALPAEASAAPLRLAVNRQKPISGTFDAEGEVKPLWDLLVGRDRTLSGIVDAKGRLSGSLGDPRIEGNMRLSGGRFGDGATGLDLQNIDLTASLENSTVNLVRAQADDGHNGKLSGTGRISLVRNGASDLEIQAIKFRLLDNETATIIGSGKTRLVRGGDGRVKLQGALNIDRADIAANPPVPSGVVPMEVIELNRPQSISLATTKKNASSRLAVDLDVDLTANRGLFVKGRGLDVEFSLDAHVGGTTSSPVLTGRSRVIRGDYDFSGKRFTFDQRSTVDLSTAPEKIKLNLTATRDDTSLTAVVKITGSAARPRIDLSSTPSLPDDEIMSQVLFGASASQLSPLEAAQLAAAVSALASGGGFDVIGGLRNLAGLDRLAFAGGGSGDLTVAGGKYLTDDVYLELIGGGREGPAAQVEWRVQRNLSLVSRLSSQGGSKLSVKWRRDY
jgi:translocation and assembly module TamB